MTHSETLVTSRDLAEGFYHYELETPRGKPVRTFLPTGYERNYPYPLLVFLHGHGSNEEQILRLAPNLSRRNYVCISIRGTEDLGICEDGQPGYGWGPDAPCDVTVEDYVFRAIEQTRRSYHIHSERIFLAGFCEGATLAFRLGLAHPEKFGGVISLNGALPRGGAPFFRYPALRQLRVLIGHGIANSCIPHSVARSDFKLLHTAGVTAQMHTYTTTNRIHPNMLRDIDRWIMRAIDEAAVE
jgi:phospholipase/carboxylesterase